MNTRFAVATHIIAFIEASAGEPASSEAIAASVNTNPTLVRRILVQLNKAGLTRSQMGPGGGALLARPAIDISLLDVYGAIDGETLLTLHEAPNAKCPVGKNIRSALTTAVSPAEAAFFAQLAKTTIADLATHFG